MVAVYSDDAPPLEDVNRQLVNFIEVYEHNGSGWVFSHFASLKLTLWHLRAIAFVPMKVTKHDFSSLLFPVPISSIGSFDTKNNLSINVYGVDNDKKVIYPCYRNSCSRCGFALVRL